MPEALFAFDKSWREKGFFILAGVDEAGRGPWAGPVAAAAVVLSPESHWPDLNDSKKLSPDVREKLFDKIRQQALYFSVQLVFPDVIDKINILQATFQAMTHAVKDLGVTPALVLVDGNRRIPQIPARSQQTVVGGDGKSASIAAASVLAKVTRDHWMIEAHQKFPQYNFANNKGYGTPDHAAALRRYGPSPLHRKSYAPVRAALAPELPFEPVA
ncbi:MAG: ribonuclease HII [Elusimicrobia bacterium]|jgi:ribonuclease HII|nr:ribonuclease HII [Elusimicrobiota bacterium]